MAAKTLSLMFVFAWVLGLSFALLGIPTETLGIPTETAAVVPSPIVGAGLPGLIAVDPSSDQQVGAGVGLPTQCWNCNGCLVVREESGSD